MTSIDVGFDPDCVPTACTLPTVEQPLRLAEFDALFTALTRVERVDATHAILTLAGTSGLAARAQDLADRESVCCSFFDFDIAAVPSATAAQDLVHMSIAVHEAHAAVLRALVDRAEQQAGR